MIHIDLLPEDIKIKRKKQFRMPQLNVGLLPVLIGVVILLVISHVSLLIAVNINKSSYARMSKEWKVAEPKKKSIESIRKENIKNNKHVISIEELMKKKVLWFAKLNRLSDLIIPGVWYTGITLDEKTIVKEPVKKPRTRKVVGRGQSKAKTINTPYLKIEGEVSSSYGEELAIIGKFIDTLKSDKEFFKDFTNIELDSTELHTIVDTEVMKFTINCYMEEVDRDVSG